MTSALQILPYSYYDINMNQPKIDKKSKEAKYIISLMIENELAFADLYYKYSMLFVDGDFWEELSRQEKRHAQWLKTLFESHDVLSLSPTFLSPLAIEMMVAAVEAEIVSEKKDTLAQALKKSLIFEKSFLENDFFEIFSDDVPSVKKVMTDLKAETKEHIKFIEAEIVKVGQDEE